MDHLHSWSDTDPGTDTRLQAGQTWYIKVPGTATVLEAKILSMTPKTVNLQILASWMVAIGSPVLATERYLTAEVMWIERFTVEGL